MDANGALYGTTYNGGAAGYGTVFQLSPPAVQGGSWTETVLYRFTNGNDGAYPGRSALVFDASGNLYGNALFGGSGGGGTVFQMTPPTTSGGTWGYNVLLSFSSQKTAPGGCGPESLLPGPSGSFYGIAGGCGAHGGGIAYKLMPPTSGGQWTETVLHSFGFPGSTGDGNTPVAGLSAGAGGVLYGTTEDGGTSGLGTVYQLTPTHTGGWTETVLHSFDTDGYPVSPVTPTTSGVLFGTTQGLGVEGGTVFKLSPPTVSGGSWTETTLVSFTINGTNGEQPEAGLLLYKGALYGTTYLGGNHGFGTVFKLF
jgi:uncharacterized repeat protein (TIGR03803 family)